jgi:hypothetical protein
MRNENDEYQFRLNALNRRYISGFTTFGLDKSGINAYIVRYAN